MITLNEWWRQWTIHRRLLTKLDNLFNKRNANLVNEMIDENVCWRFLVIGIEDNAERCISTITKTCLSWTLNTGKLS